MRRRLLAGAGQQAAGDWQARGRGSRSASSGTNALADADKPDRALRAARRTRRRVGPWRLAFFGVLVLAVAGAGAWVLFGPNVLVVRHEEVTGNRAVPAAEVLAAAAIRPGAPMESVDTAAIARRVERIPRVLTAAVSKSWPDTIVIAIRERTAELAVAGTGQYALIDGYGVTLGSAPHRPRGLPLLLAPPVHLRGNPGVRAAVMVLQRLSPALRSLVQTVTAPAADAVTFGLRGGVTVVWGGPALTREKAAELAVLLQTRALYVDVSDPSAPVTQR